MTSWYKSSKAGILGPEECLEGFLLKEKVESLDLVRREKKNKKKCVDILRHRVRMSKSLTHLDTYRKAGLSHEGKIAGELSLPLTCCRTLEYVSYTSPG